MHGAATGGVKIVLRTEGAFVLLAALIAYGKFGLGWSVFAWFFLAPDLAFLGYLAGARVGSVIYNATHSYVGAVSVLAVGAMSSLPELVAAGLIWCAHIGMDRALGYGLKYAAGFGVTHLGVIGRARFDAEQADEERLVSLCERRAALRRGGLDVARGTAQAVSSTHLPKRGPGSPIAGATVMGPGQTTPNEFELAILDRLAESEPSIQGSIGELHVLSREFTGVGSFTNFVCEEAQPGPPEDRVVLDAMIQMPGVPNGMGAVLVRKGGRPQCLEVFTYGDDRWEGVYGGFAIE